MQVKGHIFKNITDLEILRIDNETPNTTIEETSSPTTVEETTTVEEQVIEKETSHADTGSTGDNAYRVILYNDDWHTHDEVMNQLQKATGCSAEEAIAIIWMVELRGRGICFYGSRDQCHRVTRILREIRLQCEVDCD